MTDIQPVEAVGVLLWDDDDERFYEMEFNAVFTNSKITLNIPLIKKETEINLPSDRIIPISVVKQDETSRVLVHILNLTFAMTYVQAIRVEKYYIKHNEILEKLIDENNLLIDEVCNSLNNEIYAMATNVIKLVDQSILLNHDAVIVLQRIYSLNKIDKIELYDSDVINNDDFTYYVSPLYEAIGNFADLLEEENVIETEHKKSVAWELVKRVSIPYYANIWKTSYEKFLDEPLQRNDNPEAEADGTLDRYIEEIILCNEINHKSEEILAYFTYYMMENGYSVGIQYFPAYFDMCKQAFEVIEENLRKNLFKNKLKGNVEIKKSHCSIDDIDLMNGSEFENFIGNMFSKMGYSTDVTKHSGDQGIDVIAKRNDLKIGIQAKCYSNSVGNSAIQEAVAGKKYYNCDKVIVVTNNIFTSSAIELAKSNDVILWDRNILKEKITELY